VPKHRDISAAVQVAIGAALQEQATGSALGTSSAGLIVAESRFLICVRYSSE
jgi:hypothetical protein